MVSAWKDNKILKKWIKKNCYDFFDGNFNYDMNKLGSDPLLKSISTYLNVESKYIYVGAGSSQIINAIVSLPCWDHILIPYPEFKLYERTAKLQKQKINSINATRCNDFIEKIRKTKSSKDDLLCISSPRWFTGEKFVLDEIKELLDIFSGNILIDEAYIDFSNNTNQLIELCMKNERIMLSRTFSKKFYLSGLRVGYLITKKNIPELRDTAIPPHSISTFASKFIIKLLNDNKMMNVFNNTVKVIKHNREYLYNNLINSNYYEIIKSEANFVTLIFKDREKFKSIYSAIKNYPGVQGFDEKIIYIKIWVSNIKIEKEIVNSIKNV